jgi:hypothetical protein
VHDHAHRAVVQDINLFHRAHGNAGQAHVIAGEQARNVAKIGLHRQRGTKQILPFPEQHERHDKDRQAGQHKQDETDTVAGSRHEL